MNLGNLCTTSGVLTLFLILKYAFVIICTLVPIIVIIRSIVTLFPVIISGDKIKESLVSIFKSFIAGIIVFLLPSCFTFIFTSIIDLSDSGVGLCFTNASLDKINELRELEKQDNKENALKDRQENLDAANEKQEKENEHQAQLGANNDGNNNDNNNNQESYQGLPGYGSVFVGDSRTVGYQYQLSLRDTDKIFATSGGAMEAFRSDINQALNYINSNPSHRYNLILNYGVNGVNEDWVSAYKEVIDKLNGKANILIVSVNPCNDSIAKYCRNEYIVPLNNKLRNAFSSGYKDVKYCDTYTPFVNSTNYKQMIETEEGIHYTNEGANFIYDKIKNCLNSF